MEAKFLIGAVACADKERVAAINTRDCLVVPCEHCKKMAWISNDLWKLKKERPDHSVTCHKCLEEMQADPDTVIHFAAIDNLDDAHKAVSEFEEMMKHMGEFENFPDMLKKFENDLFAKTQSHHEQVMRHIEEILPFLCACAMGTLRIFERFEDFVIANILRTFVEELLFRRRETIGPGKIFDGYEPENVINIMRFIIGVGVGMNYWKERRVDAANVPEEYQERWAEGYNHWMENVWKYRNGEDE